MNSHSKIEKATPPPLGTGVTELLRNMEVGEVLRGVNFNKNTIYTAAANLGLKVSVRPSENGLGLKDIYVVKQRDGE